MTRLASPTGRDIALRPVRSNAGIEAQYRKRLTALVEEMNASILHWVGAGYKQQLPRIAQDDSPAEAMRALMRRMAAQWMRNFDTGAEKLAAWFAQKNRDYADRALAATLKDAGFSVEFRVTQPINDALEAVIGENVSLIKSIASRHLSQVETLVMQSVQQGRDLGTLAKGLQKQFGVSKRRAALIARDQNNKATAAITRTRQQSLGITQAKWRHSGAGKEPRPSHVHADGKVYDLARGMYLDGVWTWPGVEINCRCTSSPIIPGFIE
jgi:SPP1 gp7 family putative phage head morphogenesis protein